MDAFIITGTFHLFLFIARVPCVSKILKFLFKCAEIRSPIAREWKERYGKDLRRKERIHLKIFPSEVSIKSFIPWKRNWMRKHFSVLNLRLTLPFGNWSRRVKDTSLELSSFYFRLERVLSILKATFFFFPQRLLDSTKMPKRTAIQYKNNSPRFYEILLQTHESVSYNSESFIDATCVWGIRRTEYYKISFTVVL